MIKTHRINNPKKAHNTVSDKRGFTLVELTVVMALVAILMVMIVSFSTMMGDFAGAEESEYAFLEDVSALKETLSDWVAENDVAENQFIDQNDGKMAFHTPKGQNAIELRFLNGTFYCGEDELQSGLDEIDSVELTPSPDSNNLIKCTAKRETGESISFVITLRSAITR